VTKLRNPGVWIAAPILILTTCLLFGPAAEAQSGGYIRVVTKSSGEIAGPSVTPARQGWIAVRQVTMPTAKQIGAMRDEQNAAPSADAAKEVHPPVSIVKDRDTTSLALLGAMTSHQRFPEIDIDMTNHSDEPVARYKLIDAMVIGVRVSDPVDPTQQPLEVVKMSYARIEILQ
jgi:type VI protein secretion system component Hcp